LYKFKKKCILVNIFLIILNLYKIFINFNKSNPSYGYNSNSQHQEINDIENRKIIPNTYSMGENNSNGYDNVNQDLIIDLKEKDNNVIQNRVNEEIDDMEYRNFIPNTYPMSEINSNGYGNDNVNKNINIVLNECFGINSNINEVEVEKNYINQRNNSKLALQETGNQERENLENIYQQSSQDIQNSEIGLYNNQETGYQEDEMEIENQDNIYQSSSQETQNSEISHHNNQENQEYQYEEVERVVEEEERDGYANFRITPADSNNVYLNVGDFSIVV
jgi:hypothetical protein